jgi:hypothetical protein
MAMYRLQVSRLLNASKAQLLRVRNDGERSCDSDQDARSGAAAPARHSSFSSSRHSLAYNNHVVHTHAILYFVLAQVHMQMHMHMHMQMQMHMHMHDNISHLQPLSVK